MHMLFGNHDKKKRSKKCTNGCLKEYYCESCDRNVELFPGIEVTEGILLKDERNGIEILLTHGQIFGPVCVEAFRADGFQGSDQRGKKL